jgi:hypothetical protein
LDKTPKAQLTKAKNRQVGLCKTKKLLHSKEWTEGKEDL